MICSGSMSDNEMTWPVGSQISGASNHLMGYFLVCVIILMGMWVVL